MFLQFSRSDLVQTSRALTSARSCAFSMSRYLLRVVCFYFYRPKRSFGQGNIFTPVCHSVHRVGGGYLTRYPPGTRYTPPGPGTSPPGPGTPPRDQVLPQDQVPPGTRYTPPGPGTPPQDQVHHPPGPGTPPWNQVPPRPGTPPWDQVHPPGPGTPPLGPGIPPSPRTRYPPDQVPPRTRYTSQTRYTPRDQVHPPGLQTPEYGQRSVGTHPTGMHSCCNYIPAF